MTDLYLIAHKVRGEPAFDVATRMECPECRGVGEYCTGADYYNCTECDQLGYWWIIPTSGHRAYPFGNWPLCAWDPIPEMPSMPEGPHDHYITTATYDKPKLNLTALMPKAAPIRRRA